MPRFAYEKANLTKGNYVQKTYRAQNGQRNLQLLQNRQERHPGDGAYFEELWGDGMRTTKKDFDLFKQYANEWIDKLGLKEWSVHFYLGLKEWSVHFYLGLKEWSVHFYHGDLEAEYALTNTNTGGMVATITLGTYWDDLRPKTDEQLNRLAFHEVLHLLMKPLVSEAQERYTTPYQLEAIEHSIIRRLENTIKDEGYSKPHQILEGIKAKYLEEHM